MNAELLRQQRRRPKYFEKRRGKKKANEHKNYVPSLFPYKLIFNILILNDCLYGNLDIDS